MRQNDDTPTDDPEAPCDDPAEVQPSGLHVDDRLSGIEAAVAHAETLREERTEVVEWEYERTGEDDYERHPKEVDFADPERLAADVAKQTVDATYYAEEETQKAGETPEGVPMYRDVTRYVVTIAGEERELVIQPGTASVDTRRATPVTTEEIADDQELLSPPTYGDAADEAGDGR